MRSLLLLALLCGRALAEPVVLAIDGNDIYVEVGAKDGVGAGARLTLIHEVVATDPTTGKQLRDQFALGELRVERSGDGVSVAHADEALAKRVLAGDQVRLVGDKKQYVDPWQAKVDSAPHVQPGAAPIDHDGLARQAWQDTLGQPPEARVARWQELLAADPGTPLRRAIEIEVKSLRSQIAARDQAIAHAKEPTRDRAARIAELAFALSKVDPSIDAEVIAAAPIPSAQPGKPLAMTFLVRAPAKFQKTYLYARVQGETGYHRSELVPDGDAYLRGTIAAVEPPAIEWYAEADGRPVLGSLEMPRVIAVAEPLVEPPPAQGRSHIDMHVDYVDWDGKLGKGYDQYYQAEADFMYRFLTPVYSMRLGFGTLSGTGGPKDVIDHSTNCMDANGQYRCERIDFSYVYTELELRLRKNVALMVRPQLGVVTTDNMAGADASHCTSRDTEGCQFMTGAGGRLRLRLGEEIGTNLVLGASFSRGVGTLLEASYHWLPARVVPVQITVQVTDQPVIDDFGVRLIGDVGYRQLGWFYPSVRVSYQARSLDHTGVSGGMAMNFDW
ncbi:MAG: hypothetical protein QM831_28615 [Kofleriaceae bacterium]